MQKTKSPKKPIVNPSIPEIQQAAWLWYGSTDDNEMYRAENRLMAGEKV